jgi:hypothetical protein
MNSEIRMESADDTALVKPRPWTWILGLVCSLIFVVPTVVIISDGQGDPILWAGLIVFGSAAILFLLALLPGASYLRLDRSGFTVCHLFHKQSYRWHDVSPFTAGRMLWYPKQVGFSTRESEAVLSKVGPRRRNWLLWIAGNHQVVLGGHFRMPAKDLAATMNRWRDEAIRRGPATSPEPPPQWPLRRRQRVVLAILWAYIAIVAGAFCLEFHPGW